MARLAVAAFGLALALVLGEIGLRLASPIPPDQLLPLTYKRDRLRRLATGDTYVRFDQELGWVTMPGVTRRDTQFTYRNNRAGLRAEREYTTAAPAGVRRLAAFGESFTYCQESDFDDCWTDLLEREWTGTEVLNYGVPGYGPDQAWLRYQREGAEYRPCGVLIGFMAENVNRVVNRFFPFYQPDTGLVAGKPRYVARDAGLELVPNPVADPRQMEDPAWVERELGPGDRWYFPGLFAGSAFDRLMVYRVGRSAAYRFARDDATTRAMERSYAGRDEAFQLTVRILTAFARQVEANGARSVVIVFSPASEIEAQMGSRAPIYSPLLAALRAENVPVVDVTDALVARARQVGVNGVIQFHYREAGNRAVAEALAQRLPPLIGSCGGA
ncbi:MAG: hypothetical protein U0821_27270 [Chloroflexota bacterium]